jgi:hypothetical protein
MSSAGNATSYTVQAQTEFMKNQKAAQVLSDQSPFQVLQTSTSHALFFSIGDTGIFYLSVQQEGQTTGWTPIDLTTELQPLFPAKTISAKAFAVSQSPTTQQIQIAQVIHITEDNSDAVLVLSGLSNADDASWLQSAANRAWAQRPYDNTEKPLTLLNVAYVKMPSDQDPSQLPYAVVGVQGSPYIQNYLVSTNPTTKTGIWSVFETAENYDVMLDLQLGLPQGALSPGLYELYSIESETSLTFTPLAGVFGPPDVTKLSPPAGASSLAVAPTGTGSATNLYVAGTGGLYFYGSTSQGNGAAGVQIITDALIADIQYLEAHTSGTVVTVWGRNGNGDVFYARGAAGNQQDPTQWSAPIPIQQGVDQLSSLLDFSTQASVLYAHTAGASVVQLTQDPVTTLWRTQSLLLPSLNVQDVIEFYSYTTHLNIVDENNLPVVSQDVSVTATSPVGVYIDGAYLTLSPSIPIPVMCGVDATITIIQVTATLGAVCYNLLQGDGSSVNVNPMCGPVSVMQAAVANGTDLAGIMVCDEQGNTVPLVPPTIPGSQVSAVQQGMAQFVATYQSLPQDGSVQTSGPGAASPTGVPDTSWGMSFANGDVTYFDGGSGASALLTADPAGALEAFAGDIFAWLEGLVADVDHFIVQVVDGVTNFFIQIGADLFHFVMDCVASVVHAIQFIFAKIEVGIEQLVQWLGFIFNWGDIVRTHRVLKNILAQYCNYCVANISGWRAALGGAFTNIEDAIQEAVGLPPVPGTATSASVSTGRPAGSASPQAHYGSSHAKSGAASATTQYSASMPQSDELESLLNAFLTLLQNEEEAFTNAYQQLKTDVIDQITTLTVAEIIEKLVAIVFDVILDSVENAMLAVVDIMAALVGGVTTLLEAPIQIPVLSWFYKQISGDDLSVLDLACLIVAIPVTVVGKLVLEETPFPDNAFTASIINAPDFPTIQELYQSSLSQATTGALAAVSPSAAAILNLTGGISAYFGALGVMVFSALKFLNSTNLPLALLYLLSYLFYVASDVTSLVAAQAKTWDQIMNVAVCGVSVVKCCVDVSLVNFVKGAENPAALALWNAVSPAAEAIINVVWQVPVIAAIVRDHDGPVPPVAFIGNTAFDAGGWITPGTSYPKDPTTRSIFLAGTIVCSGVYGQLSLVQGVLEFVGG